MTLGRDVFLALSTIIWATDEVAPAAAAALLEAARAYGLSGDDLAAVERSTRRRVILASAVPFALDREESMLAYGLATWLARTNKTLLPSECRAIQKIGDALGLHQEDRQRAAVAGRAIRDGSDGVGDHDVKAAARALAARRQH